MGFTAIRLCVRGATKPVTLAGTYLVVKGLRSAEAAVVFRDLMVPIIREREELNIDRKVVFSSLVGLYLSI